MNVSSAARHSQSRSDDRSNLHIGIDLGGTKIEIILLDNNGHEILRQRCATPQASCYPDPSEQYHQILETIIDLVNQAHQQLGSDPSAITSTRIGIGIPGAISPATGLIKNANTTCLIGQNLQQDLNARLQQKVVIANDADCFTLSEATDGAGQRASSVFGVILGTGVGGGLFLNGRLLSGPNAIAGEWGHNPLPWPQSADTALPCYCGKSGCIETFLSGPGMAKHALRHPAVGSAYQAYTAKDWSAELMKGSPSTKAAITVMDEYCDRLARALASVINIVDPEAIVLGGGLSNIDYLYQRVPQLWSKYVFSDHVNTQLLANHHGDSSGVRGAAWLGASKVIC